MSLTWREFLLPDPHRLVGPAGSHGGVMAADDLPGVVVDFLNVCGVEWPYVNEDSLFDFGTVVREFAQALENTHRDATSTVQAVGSAWQGPAYGQLNSGWSTLTDGQVSDLVTACNVVAGAFDAAAHYIIGQKAEAVVQLVGLATAFFAEQAAAVETLGFSEAAAAATVAAGKKLGDALIQDMEQYIIGKLTSAAIEPFLEKVETAMNALNWEGQGEPAPGGGPAGEGFGVDTVVLRQHAETMDGHAATFGQHATDLGNKASGITF